MPSALHPKGYPGTPFLLAFNLDRRSLLPQMPPVLRECLCNPIPEILDAARYLDAAVSAHLSGRHALAEELIRLADIPAISQWSESLWGAGGPWSRPPLAMDNPPPFVPKDQRIKTRMPGKSDLAVLLARDGFHCRFCGIPLVRAETRMQMRAVYPEAVRWGDRNAEQHAGLQAMWLQYDHLLPHARGGTNELTNMIVSCAPCNNGRSNLTLDEVGLASPLLRPPQYSNWDGLERFR